MSLQNLLGQNLMDIKAKSLSAEGGVINGPISPYVGVASIAIGASAPAAAIAVAGLTTSAVILAQIASGVDATLTSIVIAPAAGQFTITGNANATAAVSVNWFVAKL